MQVFSKVAIHGTLAAQDQKFAEIQSITVLQAGDVSIDIRPDEVVSIAREGDNLIIELIDDDHYTIENFFGFTEACHLYFQDDNFSGTIWRLNLESDAEQGILAYTTQEVPSTNEGEGGLLAFILGGIGAAIVVGSSSGSHSTDNSDNESPTVTLHALITSDTTPELTGTVDDQSATVVVTVNSIDYNATNNGDGTWTLADNTLPTLPEGIANATVTATDPQRTLID